VRHPFHFRTFLKKGGTNMNYQKPELIVLGNAKALVEDPQKKASNVADGINQAPPAYDLDD
jgi:hypothetical protein